MKTNTNEPFIFKWKRHSQKTICTTPVLTVSEIDSESPQGTTGKYTLLEAFDWVITIPVIYKDGVKHFLLVKQWRHGSDSPSVEFPGGVINKGEHPEEAAHRELLEETGFSAQEMTHLVSVNPNPAIMTNTVHIFAADKLSNTGSQHLDSDEFIQTLTQPAFEVFAFMGKGDYCHGLMGTALLAFMQKFSLD